MSERGKEDKDGIDRAGTGQELCQRVLRRPVVSEVLQVHEGGVRLQKDAANKRPLRRQSPTTRDL